LALTAPKYREHKNASLSYRKVGDAVPHVPAHYTSAPILQTIVAAQMMPTGGKGIAISEFWRNLP